MHRKDSNLRGQKGWTLTLIIICIISLLAITILGYTLVQEKTKKSDMKTFLNMGITILQQELNLTTKEYNSHANNAIEAFLNSYDGSYDKLVNRSSPWSKKKSLWTYEYSSDHDVDFGCRLASKKNKGQITLCAEKTRTKKSIFLVARDDNGNILDEITLSADITLPTIPNFWTKDLYWANETGKNCDIYYYNGREPKDKFERDPRLTHCWLESVKQKGWSSLWQAIAHASRVEDYYHEIIQQILHHMIGEDIVTEQEYETEFKKMTTERITQVLKNYTLLAFPDGTSLSDL